MPALPEALVRDIEYELSQIEEELRTIKPLSDLLVIRDPDPIELRAAASVLHAFYNGVESVFLLIAKNVDKCIPQGDIWHRDLLGSMATAKSGVRLQVVSQALFERLQPYMTFRHFYRHSYSFKLKWALMKPFFLQLNDVFSDFRSEINSFIRGS